MKTSTNKEIKGWNNIYTPKNLKVKVAEWLAENDLEDDAKNIDANATFADFKKFIQGTNEYGMQVVDVQACEIEYCENGYMDSFLRDVIFDALDAIKK
jgi:hypothetical protein